MAGEKGFVLKSKYKPTGDQPRAIEELVDGLRKGVKMQTLLGVTGSGKTFTMANIIAEMNKPALVLAHNKTLAAQLCAEFREYFPENAVEYFVSYYDYYQPEAYIPGKDMYIEKDVLINEEIDRLRHGATSSLFERRDVIIVSSVSCIYSLGDPAEYSGLVIRLKEGIEIRPDEVLRKLVSIGYERNDINFVRDKFRVRGDTVEIFPASNGDRAVRIEFFGDVIERISEFDPVTGKTTGILDSVSVYPATHYAVSREKKEAAIAEIKEEMRERARYFRSMNLLSEARRIEERVNYDMEMLSETGFCHGIENYSRILSGRKPGSTPNTLLDYFPKDYLLFIDESHVTVPQVRGMSRGDLARKKNLVDYGFRLPSAYDNRPLYFGEFEDRINQVIFVSATPGVYERTRSGALVEQLIRPTGLTDPAVEVRPAEGQIDDLTGEIKIRAEKGERVLVTTLTKKMAEDLSEYFGENGIKSRYIHFNVDTMERMEIIRDLRLGVFDVLIGINLLREGLDIPEVSLVAILDADKEGFLRNETSLIQTIGRAARNVNGKVIMYAETMTDSMKKAVEETDRRRKIQTEYNISHGITPRTIVKEIRDVIEIKTPAKKDDAAYAKEFLFGKKKPGAGQTERTIEILTKEMRSAARNLEFEKAAFIRDRIKEIKGN